MKHTESIGSLAAALVAAQLELKAVGKDSTNPHYKNRYASLDNIVEAVRPVLAKHGLAVLQGASAPVFNNDGDLGGFDVETMLVHKSGEWLSNSVIMPLTKIDAQGAGSALTYGRRYGLSALLSLATDDDEDGHAASAPRAVTAPIRTVPPIASIDERAPLEEPTADVIPVCPKCGGLVWDNRLTKKNPRQPDFKCRDKSCDGVIWPPKPGTKPPVAMPKQLAPKSDDEAWAAAVAGDADNLPF